MKKYILTAITAVALISGCKKDLLETAPYSQVASETMWTTDNLTDLGMTGVYAQLRYGNASGGASGLELYQMDCLGFTGQTTGVEALLSGTITPANTYFSSHWHNLF
jgi:hypothetical protein